MKKLIKYMLVMILSTNMLLQVNANPNVLYVQTITETVTKGVTYEFSRRLTNEGFLDVNVLKVKLDDANISIAPVQSKKELGLKETLLDLLYVNGAVAGINGDFFGINGSHSASFGVALDNGNILATSDDKNIHSNDYSTFFIDAENTPYMDFIKMDFEFLNDGVKNIEVNAINKAGSQIYAMKFDKNGGDTTEALDSRFKNLVKIVVENNVITYISQKGEIMPVPENGYLIITNEQWYDERAELFSVGQTAEFKINSSLDINNVKTALSGGAKILDNGSLSANPGEVISPKSRQPRTALGITENGEELILMVVDGRSHSIGATQEELGYLLLEYGVYNAMNFDGGGSSTMIAKTLDDTWLTIKNTLSEGSQRKVINGLGIFNNSIAGDIVELVVKPDQTKVFKDMPIKLDIYGYDEYYNKINIPLEDIKITTNDNDGVWKNEYFYPSITSDLIITAEYGDFISNTKVKVSEVAEIKSNIPYIALEKGETTNITLKGVDKESFKANISISKVNFEVVPDALGTIENGIFTAVNDGEGYVKCSIGNVNTYIPVMIGSIVSPIISFEQITSENILFTSHPDNLNGLVEITNEKATVGETSLKLQYSFELSDNLTQASYLNFVQPIEIPENPTALELDVYGDNSNNWLRGRIIDAQGVSTLIDFAKQIDFTGFKQVKATLPTNLTYPIRLDRIYVASLSNNDTSEKTIYIDNLRGVYNSPNTKQLPQSTTYKDNKNVDLSNNQLENSFDITILPSITVANDVKPANYIAVQTEVFDKFKFNSSLGIFLGDANVENSDNIIKYSSNYKVHKHSKVDIIEMTAKNGGLRNTNQEQWRVFEGDIRNSDKQNIIILLDKNPLNFTDAKEKELFQSIMENIYNTGKNIFIVSSEGPSTWATVSNGIRYMNIGSLFKQDGSVNEHFKMVRFRINENNMLYEFN